MLHKRNPGEEEGGAGKYTYSRVSKVIFENLFVLEGGCKTMSQSVQSIRKKRGRDRDYKQKDIAAGERGGISLTYKRLSAPIGTMMTLGGMLSEPHTGGDQVDDGAP